AVEAAAGEGREAIAVVVAQRGDAAAEGLAAAVDGAGLAVIAGEGHHGDAGAHDAALGAVAHEAVAAGAMLNAVRRAGIQPAVDATVEAAIEAAVNAAIEPCVQPAIEATIEASVQPTVHATVDASVHGRVGPTLDVGEVEEGGPPAADEG